MDVQEIYLERYRATRHAAGMLVLGTVDSYGNEQLHLNLADEWQGLTVTATFVVGEDSATRMVMDPDTGLVDVPWEATALAGEASAERCIVFCGVDEDATQRITVDLPYRVLRHHPTDGDDATEPTVDAMTQALAYMASSTAAAEAAAASAAEAVEAMENVNEAIDSAIAEAVEKTQAIADSAAQYADNAAASADAAAASAATAKDYAASCEYYAEQAEAAIDAISEMVGVIRSVPKQAGTLTYNGEEQEPKWNGFGLSDLTISGTTSAVDAGTYIVVFSLPEGYSWTDGTTDDVQVTWTIGRAAIAMPVQIGKLSYTGEELTPEWDGYDSAKMLLEGDTSGTDVGNYTATFTPYSNWEWEDGTTGAADVAWEIYPAAADDISQSVTLIYTGAAQSPTWDGYDAAAVMLSGTLSATDAGTYAVTATLNEGYMWADGTTGAKTVFWVIDRAAISAVPSQSGSLTYTGNTLTPTWSGYDSLTMTIGGTTSAAAAGSYVATFTPGSNYQWSDGTTTAKSVVWTIGKASLTVPAQSGTLTYTGSALTPTWTTYSSSTMSIGGVTTATSAGTYTATFTPNSNYQWSDGTTSTKSVTWTIAKASLTVPSQSGTLTYTGSALSPTWSNYNTARMTVGGTTSATNAGTYTATFALTSSGNYQWADGTTTVKSVSWTIAKKSLAKPTRTSAASVNYNGDWQYPTIANYNASYMTRTLTVSDDTATAMENMCISLCLIYILDGISMTTAELEEIWYGALCGELDDEYNLVVSVSSTTNGDWDDVCILATYAGTYTYTYTLNDTSNYQWSDGTTAAVTVTWTVNQLANSLSISYTCDYVTGLLTSNRWVFNPFKLAFAGGKAAVTVSNLYDSYTAENLYSKSTGDSAPSSPFSYLYNNSNYYPYSKRTVASSYEETYIVEEGYTDDDGNFVREGEREETRTVYVYSYERVDTVTLSSGVSYTVRVYDSTTESNNWIKLTVNVDGGVNYKDVSKVYLLKAYDTDTIKIYEDGTCIDTI